MWKPKLREYIFCKMSQRLNRVTIAVVVDCCWFRAHFVVCFVNAREYQSSSLAGNNSKPETTQSHHTETRIQ